MRTSPLERPVAPAATNLFSTTSGLGPRRARWKARLAPCTPAPMMITSAVVGMSGHRGRDDAPRARPQKRFLHNLDAGRVLFYQGDHVTPAASAAQLRTKRTRAARSLHEALQLRR